ncbi:acetyl-CoA carboxylase biotin carboxyl carrier protein subunit [Ventosimonas gracilis]|uniref:Acetyl-CoA carboxylase biotin carboxyl carrier protein subunit n=1 Tax=Ventosimonas gracilis TaxID=1680762 RepID=A0A139SUK6_9GAMM|nr:acetyl-CoA carboxylase [Ventosimonas gracilis]KXU38273.1 acetyl-CoA carboxylase biotin carboxyl carrier protein subunit [Ventosimonas gracilis]
MSTIEIKSPLPGVFYRSASPESPVLKADGDAVEATDVIGLIEVMKSFHQICAGIAGLNIRFLVDDGDAVMAGQTLAEVQA